MKKGHPDIPQITASELEWLQIGERFGTFVDLLFMGLAFTSCSPDKLHIYVNLPFYWGPRFSTWEGMPVEWIIGV